MKPSGIVTLLTDFGTRDPFVGVMKGVILARGPALRLVDLTHEIEAQRVGDAAFWLGQSFGWFPAGTVHVAVVDPGVGSERAPLAVRAQGHLFVGPDNGIFEVVLRHATAAEARELKPEHLELAVPSRTFHGRDLFAPFGAALAAGTLDFGDVGPLRKPTRTTLVPEAARSADGAEGVVVVVDRFGNLITNVPGETLLERPRASVSLAGKTLKAVRTYSEVPEGVLCALVGSHGMVEIFARNGSAAERLTAKRGTPVRVHA
jgi:S-adenosylmethionine hydrolase